MIRVKEYNKTLSLGVRYLATKESVVKRRVGFTLGQLAYNLSSDFGCHKRGPSREERKTRGKKGERDKTERERTKEPNPEQPLSSPKT